MTSWEACDVIKCTARSAFLARNKDEISFSEGDTLCITHKTKDWVRGKLENTEIYGVFPESFVISQQEEKTRTKLTIELFNHFSNFYEMMEHLSTFQDNTQFLSVRVSLISLFTYWERILSNPSRAAIQVSELIGILDEMKINITPSMIIRQESYFEKSSIQNCGVYSLCFLHKQAENEETQKIQNEQLKKILTVKKTPQIKATAVSDGTEHVKKRKNLLKGGTLRRRSAAAKSAQSASLSTSPEERGGTLRPSVLQKFSPKKFKETDEKRRSGSVEIPNVSEMFFPMEYASKYQLHIDIKSLDLKIEEPSTIFLSLYTDQGGFFTEEFPVHFEATGMPCFPENIEFPTQTIFEDLNTKDLSGLHLVAKIIRTGKMDLAPSKKPKSTINYRRPYACAVMSLSELLDLEVLEKKIPAFTTQESVWEDLPEALIRETGTYESVQDGKGLLVHAELVSGELKSILADKNQDHRDFHHLRLTRTFALPPFIEPGKERNFIHIKLMGGEFSDNNVEVEVSFRDHQGKVIPDSISFGSGYQKFSSFRSTVLYKLNNPKWNELFKLHMTRDLFGEHVNVYFVFRSTSAVENKEVNPFAYAFIELFDYKLQLVSDGIHTLQYYQVKKGVVDYLGKSGAQEKYLDKKREFRIKLDSNCTIFPQSEALVPILAWKSTSQLKQALIGCTYGDSEELIKMYKTIFDCLFEILDNQSEVSKEVYEAIVHIINLLTEAKSGNFKQALQKYTDFCLSSKKAYELLFQCMNDTLSSLDIENPLLKSSLQALDFLVKFIIKSSSSQGVDIKDKMKFFMGALNNIMVISDPTWLVARTTGITKFGTVFSEISQLFNDTEVCTIVVEFLKNLAFNEDHSQFNLAKLNLLKQVISSPLARCDEAWETLIPLIIDQLQLHLGNSVSESVICVECLGGLLDLIQFSLPEQAQNRITKILFLVPSLCLGRGKLINSSKLDLTPMSAYHENLFSAILSSLVYLVEPQTLQNYLETISDREEYFFDLQTTFLQMFRRTDSFFPERWVQLNFFQHECIVKCIFLFEFLGYSEKLSTIEDKESDLYRLSLTNTELCFEFLQSTGGGRSCGHSFQKLQQFKNLRTKIFLQIKQRAEKVSPILFPYLLTNAWKIVLTQTSSLSNEMMNVYKRLVYREFNETGGASMTEVHTIAATENVISSGQGDKSAIRSFISDCLEFTFIGNDDVDKTIAQVLKDTAGLFELLNELEQLPDDTEHANDRIVVFGKLVEYYQKIGHTAGCIDISGDLSNQHMKSGSFTEAGDAILLHAKLYDWSRNLLDPVVRNDVVLYPQESNRERKTKLYKFSIKNYERGKSWNQALLLLKELFEIATECFEYLQASEFMYKQAQIHRELFTAD